MTNENRDAADGREREPTEGIDSRDGTAATDPERNDCRDRAAARRPPIPDGGEDVAHARLVESAAVGLAVADADGRVAHANGTAADLLGEQRETLRDARISNLLPDLPAETVAEEWAALDDGDTHRTESRLDDADDHATRVEVVARAVASDDGREYHLTLSDVTERARTASELERQDERLARFASVVSHDLRNPLNVAMGRIQLLEEDCESDHIEPVDRSLRRMETLIADVLALAREGSRLTDGESLDLREAINTAWSTASVGDATLTVEDDMGTVRSEQSRLGALFENLFSNAAAHAGDAPEVRVGRLDDGFFVADDGPGIPPEDREEVFEEGYSTAEEGTGFGTTIVRDVAMAHGWSVDLAESESGGLRVEIRGVDFE